MKNEKIVGFGSIQGGEYENITVDGMGKLRGNTTAQKVKISGTFKCNGKLTAEEFTIDGFARVFREVKVKRLKNSGTLKLRRADVNADAVYSDGLLTSAGEISADEIIVKGYCSVKKMTGDHIHIYHNSSSGGSKLMRRLKWLAVPYFGRNVHGSQSLVDYIECTTLNANGVRAKLVRAGSVELENCSIGKLYCDSEPKILKNCSIKHIYYGNDKLELNRKENIAMGNVTIKKVLDLYKSNAIDAEEAELMLKSVIINDSAKENKEHSGFAAGLPWPDDNTLRIVAFLGKKLLKKGEAKEHKLEVTYEGEAKNVECHGSLNCGDVSGNATAGQSISCADIGGNVSCGGDLSCESIGGNVSCAGMMHRGTVI